MGLNDFAQHITDCYGNKNSVPAQGLWSARNQWYGINLIFCVLSAGGEDVAMSDGEDFVDLREHLASISYKEKTGSKL
jgi:hypothetical protein